MQEIQIEINDDKIKQNQFSKNKFYSIVNKIINSKFFLALSLPRTLSTTFYSNELIVEKAIKQFTNSYHYHF